MTLMVLNNLGEAAQNYTVDMPNVGFPSGLTVVDVLSCREVVVDSSGGLDAQFVEGLPMVSYYPLSRIFGKLCVVKSMTEFASGLLSILFASGHWVVWVLALNSELCCGARLSFVFTSFVFTSLTSIFDLISADTQ
jgi:hypothetical protein